MAVHGQTPGLLSPIYNQALLMNGESEAIVPTGPTVHGLTALDLLRLDILAVRHRGFQQQISQSHQRHSVGKPSGEPGVIQYKYVWLTERGQILRVVHSQTILQMSVG